MIVEDLPSHLAQTLFKKSNEYRIAIRYSTEPGDPGLDDRIPLPRGLGMKVFNVNDEMFDAGKDFPTHDIEFNSTPAIELADAKTAKEIFALRLKYGENPPELQEHLKRREDSELQSARDKVRNTHLSVWLVRWTNDQY